jgi:hypothetical protein
VLEQVVRQLPDREDVDEVEEQLERGDDAPGARETAIFIGGIVRGTLASHPADIT